MQKVWRRIFLLCMACMICLQGLCLADDEKENWVEYYRETEQPWNIYYVDTNSIKALDYNGRKYLEANVRRKEETYEYIWVVVRQIEVTNAKWHKVFDIENQKVLNLEFDNKYANPKKGKYDISELGEKGWDLHKYLFEERLEKWIEQNYPAVINKIRTHNQSLPGAKPAKPVNTGATGAPNVPSGSLEAIVGDIDYEVLDSGAVKFNVRCLTTEHMDYYRDTYYIFTKPERFKDWPGTYMVGWLADDGTMLIDNFAGFSSAFDYDPKTQLFTFYWWDYGYAFGEWRNLAGELVVAAPNSESQYHRRARLIDKNTIYEEHFMGNPQVEDGPPRTAYATTYKYMPYNAIPLKTTELNLASSYFTVEFRYSDGGIGSVVGHFDEKKCVWLGEERRYWDDGNITSGIEFGHPDEFNSRVDMMRAFLAVNGKIGAVFCDVDYNWANT